MTVSSQPSFPESALDWLTPRTGLRVLALGRGCAPLMSRLEERGHRLTANDPDPSGVQRLLAYAPHALPTVSDTHRMPFVPHAFDVIVINQSFHRVGATALPELARVLRPGGHLAIAYTTRDDSVPWVKRLAVLLQGVDPGAMSGNYGAESVAVLADCPHFPDLEQQHFRLWAQVSRDGLLDMVTRRYPRLDAGHRADLLAGVADLYDDAARSEALRLPYRVSCWRAWVEHDELTADLTLPDAGLSIALRAPQP